MRLNVHTLYIPNVATNCTHGNVRLAGGLERTEGRVEVCVQGRWSGACVSLWLELPGCLCCVQTAGLLCNRFGLLGYEKRLTNFYAVYI